MYDDKDFQKQYTIINFVFYVLKNILLSVAMVMKASTVKKKILKNGWDDQLSYKLKN